MWRNQCSEIDSPIAIGAELRTVRAPRQAFVERRRLHQASWGFDEHRGRCRDNRSRRGPQLDGLLTFALRSDRFDATLGDPSRSIVVIGLELSR